MIEPSSHTLTASALPPNGQDNDLQTLVHFEICTSFQNIQI